MGALDYSIVIIYLAGIVTLGVMLQKRASSGIDSYFLGNRKMPWWALGASGMASNMDVSGTMINTAWIFALGAAGMFIEIRGGVTLIMAFLMIFMGKWNRRAKVMTVAEWMRFRFGTKREGHVARLMAAFSIIVLVVAMITYFAVGSGKFISVFLGIPDIGQVTDVLDAEEIAAIDRSLDSVNMDMVEVNTRIDPMRIAMDQKKSFNKSWRELDATWSAMKTNVTNVNALDQMKIQFVEFKNDISTFRGAVKQETGQIKMPEIEFLFFHIDRLSDKVSQIGDYFESSTTYKVIMKAQFLAALLMITLAMIYTVASGLYGVVWTDVFQGILIFGTIIFICFTALSKFSIPDVFSISVPMKDGTYQAIQTTRDTWTSVIPPWKLNFPADSTYSIYNLFGIAILFYLIKVTIEGAGGTSQYMIQRYFASKSDRDCGLLSLFWIFLLSFRWPFIAAIAVMGVAYGASHGVISDPETVLPIVVNELIPVGIKGLLVAGLMAAAMSTFDSTVNAGASYWVKDIYQAYINPKASEKTLMRHSRWASVIIVILGLLFSLAIRNINEIWGWITMSIGAGLLIPTLVRWYWWRMNGWGFAIGTAAGMIAAVIQRLTFADAPEYVAFIFASGFSFIGMIVGTYATKPTDENVLTEFYKTTRPFGFWGPIRKKLSKEVLNRVNNENRNDKISICLAVPWQIILFLMWITVIMRRWDMFGYLFVLLVVLSVGLYFFWFRNLSTEVKIENQETSNETQ